MADEMIDEMTDLGRLPDIHLVMDFALLSTALMTGPLMTGVPRDETDEISGLGQALQARIRPTGKCHKSY
jgi:hypothetical protein